MICFMYAHIECHKLIASHDLEKYILAELRFLASRLFATEIEESSRC
mgnify:CR=1 FL=1